MRSRRLMGYDVFDRAGYDTHGVPIELQIEKEIGSKGKQDIDVTVFTCDKVKSIEQNMKIKCGQNSCKIYQRSKLLEEIKE